MTSSQVRKLRQRKVVSYIYLSELIYSHKVLFSHSQNQLLGMGRAGIHNSKHVLS